MTERGKLVKTLTTNAVCAVVLLGFGMRAGAMFLIIFTALYSLLLPTGGRHD